ncbi:YppG family protein [Thermaerobacillus caldiproteolyticus]|uniref:Spore coat-like protein n=1 Tax=Thermaerobacillus caldiproteolyticus TaxID=247480 RepID=A0A7W0BYZ7_9BACL|nr:YppG family protein [Anoxybacillus caldiproteolyticus]MBA2875080.1 hypothetical protein [Anoxybacillus caldiproteolyticus]QPA32943.1 YppG family protein [Anoxybacillus caldiproteolyticus]
MYRYPHSFPTPNSSYSPYHAALYQPYPYSQVAHHWPAGQQVSQMSPYPTPYPTPSPVLKPPAPALQSIMSQFKTSEGTYDINKMMNTMGQMINTVNQVGGMLKGLVNTFKG